MINGQRELLKNKVITIFAAFSAALIKITHLNISSVQILKSNNSTQTLISLSSILKKENINNYVLISDIEGAEYFILNEDKNVFNNCSLIIMEMHDIEIEDRVIKVEDLVNMIIDLGFSIVERYGSNVVAKKI